MDCLLEVCVDSPEGLGAAVQGGADRVELCAALALGGLTPSAGLMAMAASAPVPVHAMIRPVPGGFVLGDAALRVMLDEIAAARQAGLAGVVFGALTPGGGLDLPRLRQMKAAAGDMATTLHRAIDLCPDPVTAVEDAIGAGFDRILTSGGAQTALAGQGTVARMVARSAGRIAVMGGAGLTPETVADFVARTGVQEVHASCAGPPLREAAAEALGFGAVRRADPARVRAMRQALDRISDSPTPSSR